MWYGISEQMVLTITMKEKTRMKNHQALKDGRRAGAGLDVTEKEPLGPESPLFSMENVIVTPHYAPTTKEAATRVSRIAAENIVTFFENGSTVGRIV